MTQIHGFGSKDDAEKMMSAYVAKKFHTCMIVQTPEVLVHAEGDAIAWPNAADKTWYMVIATKEELKLGPQPAS